MQLADARAPAVAGEVLYPARPSRQRFDDDWHNNSEWSLHEASGIGHSEGLAYTLRKLHMAQVSGRGGPIASLYEWDTHFDKVVSDLKLDFSSAKYKGRIREDLTLVVGRGLQAIELSEKLNPGGKLHTNAIAATLKSVANSLREAEATLRGLETGFHSSHEIDVAIRIREVLRKNPEINNNADSFLNDCCERMNAIVQACVVAEKVVKSIKIKGGRKPIDWYDDFTRILASIARKNKIPATIVVDRDSGKAKGPFLDLAAGFELLLYPLMRSPTREAMAKRLARSLKRIK
jgi:hypothetical protein